MMVLGRMLSRLTRVSFTSGVELSKHSRATREVMPNRLLGRILIAQGLSSLGTSISTVAIAFMVYRITGSVLQMGGILAVSTFPLVVMSFIGGAFVDRYSGRSLMVVSDLARAVLILLMPFAARESTIYMYVIAGLVGVFSAVFNPSQVKVVGELISRDHLVRANSYLSMSRDGAELIGYLVGAGLVTLVGYTLSFVIDALSYCVSALFLAGLPRLLIRTEGGQGLGTLIVGSPAVLVRLWKDARLRTNLLFAVLPSAVIMMNVPNGYFLALKAFKGYPGAGVGALEVITASGLILGGLAMSRLSLKGDKNRYVFLALLWMAVCLLSVSFTHLFWLQVGLIGLGALGNAGLFVSSITMFQELAPRGDKGRLIAMRAGLGQMGAAAGFLLGGALGSAIGIPRVFLVIGLLSLVLTGLVYLPYAVVARRAAAMAVEPSALDVSGAEGE